MKILYIFGAGHGAIELLENFTLSQLCEYIIICIEDNPLKTEIELFSKDLLPQYKTIKVISYKDFLKRKNIVKSCLINSVMDCDYKERMYIENKDREWINYVVNPTTVLCWLYIGCIIQPYSFIGSTVKLGKFVKVNHGAKILVSSSVGDYSFIGTNSMLLANVTVGSKTLIYSGVTINPGIKIGNNTVIGAGSVVTKDIEDNVVAYGNPCKVVRDNK